MKSVKILATSIIILSIIISACSNLQKQVNPVPIYENITPTESFRLIQNNLNNNNFIILDVRTQEEIKNGYLKNAIFIDYKKPNFEKKLNSLKKSNIYLVYCKGGFRSQKAINLMRERGFHYLYNMDGGFDKWKEAELPYKISPKSN